MQVIGQNVALNRIAGIDSIRFIAAAFVVFSHCGYPPLTQGLDESSLFALCIQGVYGNLFPGVPAVIVFFVISGFCIHYPCRSTAKFGVLHFLVRRYLRIGIPLVAAVLIAQQLEVKLTLFQNSVLWSLLAELIYYSLYPVLRWFSVRVGWARIIAVSFVLSYGCVMCCFPLASDYSPFGPPLAAVVACPCWLIGCKLAEMDHGRWRDITTIHLWCWRLGIWALASLCSFLRFHSPIGYPWTLNLFAVAVFFWLQAEIAVVQRWERSRILEWAGIWSYSIYLVHLIAEAAHARMPLPNLGFNLNWLVKMLVIFGSSYVFYLLVERPGHFIARKLAQLTARRRSTQRTAVS